MIIIRLESGGSLCIEPAAWVTDKGTLRDFRRILRLCQASDRQYNTDTLAQWREALRTMPEAIRTDMSDVKRRSEALCADLEEELRGCSDPQECKELRSRIRDERAYVSRRMRAVQRAIGRVRKLMEEVTA